jgi:hypothetical protein
VSVLAVRRLEVKELIRMAEFQVARSPWGPDDEIGALNLITPDRRSSALAQVDGEPCL